MEEHHQPPLQQTCQEVLHQFERLVTKQEKFSYLVHLGKKHQGLLEDEKDDRFLVKGCLSRAWLIPRFEEGRISFHADSDALIVRGIIALFLRVYQHRTPEEVLSVSADFWRQTQTATILSLNRRGGMAHMLKQIRLYALSYQALEQQKSDVTGST